MKLLDGGEKRKLDNQILENIQPAEKNQSFSDGHGMRLLVPKNKNTGSWQYVYWLDTEAGKKQKTLSLGTYPHLSLAEARELHRAAYNDLQRGIDPAETAKTNQLLMTNKNKDTFYAISKEWLKFYMFDKSEAHAKRAERFLLVDLVKLGSYPIREITAPIFLAALREIEDRGAINTAHRVRGIATQVFTYAIATGRATANIPGSLQGVLRSPKRKNFAAITDPKLLGQLLRDIDLASSNPLVITALKLSPYLFQRPGEIRKMEWSELDLENGIWDIPAEKMKMRENHRVPLSRQVIKMIKDVHSYSQNSRYVFPSLVSNTKCISDNTVRVALRTLGYDKDVVTPHGFRATARTLLDEELGFRVDIIEAQLAHTVIDANGRAYNRTSFIKERIEMMQAWADYLDGLKEQAAKRCSS